MDMIAYERYPSRSRANSFSSPKMRSTSNRISARATTRPQTEQQRATRKHQTCSKIHGMAHEAVDARVNDVLAALGLNTHHLRRKGVIGECAEDEETTPEEQDASAGLAPQR